MLIDGQKWACEACIRGHRVSSCKHHGIVPCQLAILIHMLTMSDRPLIRIKRKGRPFATCSICQATPCKSPTDHARQKREIELKHLKKASHARLYPRHHNPNGFQPIAPRPTSGAKRDLNSKKGQEEREERSGSTSTSAEDSNTNTTAVGDRERLNSSSSSPQNNIFSTPAPATADSVYGEGYWSGSEASGNESSSRTLSATKGTTGRAGPGQTLSYFAPGTSVIDPSIMGNAVFDPIYSLLPSSSDVLTQPVPLVSPLDSANLFEFPLDTGLTMHGTLGCLEDMDLDITEGLEEVFHVEDWSRYMWSPETGFEHLDMGYPPVTRRQLSVPVGS
ncbi:hypothetical protein N7486_009265 [Penicillium sp. IBT 16267x]|nr:hypothetical protein N7486_009265 [Penicillium sp. IBT 16267x]